MGVRELRQLRDVSLDLRENGQTLLVMMRGGRTGWCWSGGGGDEETTGWGWSKGVDGSFVS